jgi:hypothetical protein
MSDNLEQMKQRLDEYDAQEALLRTLRADLAKQCSEYGRSNGMPFFTIDHLRRQLVSVGAR